MTDSDNQSSLAASSRGWVLPPYKNQAHEAGLYIVATPIGNMGDISLRALDTLAAVDVVLCEDTRVSSKLMAHFGIEAKLEAYHDHSDAQKRESIVSRISEGMKFALISDAGMPLISDPGYKLVCDLREAGVFVTSISGANAPLSAIQLSGMPSDAFSFIGFLPHKQGARQAHLKAWAGAPGSLVVFESSPRLKASLADVEAVLEGREVCVVREISKKFEEIKRGLPADIITYYEQEGAPKGEIVLVIEPPIKKDISDDDLELMLKEALVENGTKQAAALVAQETGLPKKRLYDLALKVSNNG